MARYWSRFALAAVLAGCAGQSPSTGGEIHHLSTHTALLAGVAQAPASVLSNNGGAVVANNGSTLVASNSSGVISNHGATLRLLAAEPWQAVPGAPVNVLDFDEKAIAGVKGVTTDASGRFGVADVPTGSVVTVQVKVGAVVLTSLAMADGSSVKVDPATTLATAQLRELFKNNPAGLAHASLAAFNALAASLQAVLTTEDVPLKLESPAAARETFQAVAARHPEVAAKAQAAAPGRQKAGGGAETSPVDVPTLAPLATPTPSPTPAPSATPSQALAASPTPFASPTTTIVTPSPGVTPTPTPRPSATETPTPSGQAAKALLKSTNVCRACDLDGLDLKDVVAPGADLAGANLQAVDAAGIKLAGAKLAGALFRLAKLGGADLSGADLTNADLTGADLTNANLANAKLNGAILDSANMAGAKLDGANLTNANASFANLAGASLTGATLTGLKLGSATWTDSRHCADGSVGSCN
jgi:hypothetical protein